MTATRIDWLGISFKDRRLDAYRFLDGVFRKVGPVKREPRAGIHGFERAEIVTIDDAHVGMLAYGGRSQNGRSYVELSGLGCSLLPDLPDALEHVLALPEPKIKRVDIAADFYHGEVPYEHCLNAYHLGKFTRGVTRPKMQQILPGDPEDGRTLYVGRRGNDVFFRCYEKGRKEHHPKFPLWTRLEVEYRPSKRPIPFDIIPQRDQFFAGSYPYLAELLPHVQPEVLVSPQRIANSNLDHALSCIKAQWGPTIFSAVVVNDGDIGAVIEKIIGTEHNPHLVHGGLLLRDRA